MRSTSWFIAVACVALVASCSPRASDQKVTGDSANAAVQTNNVTADLLSDIKQVEEKVVSLARAIPEDKYNWRPMAGVRSVGEVLLHVAGDNYLMPATLGFPPDSSTGIKADDYKTSTAFESRKLGKEATIADLEKSFAFLKQSIEGTPASKLGETATVFGQSQTYQQTWIMATTHLHEHLGQLIAYARSNSIKPPWS